MLFLTRAFLLFLCATSASAAVIVRSGAGLAAATAARDQFRADLGAARFEINWDEVPDSLAAPNAFPANYYNTVSPRGMVLSTPGTGFQVSADAGSGTPVEFGNLNPAYPAEFVTFSPERLFTPVGSTITDIAFFIPGTNVPATVSGFGAMFTDEDSGFSRIQFFGAQGSDLGSVLVDFSDRDVAFVGLSFTTGERISRVRIISGNAAPGPGAVDGPGCGFPPCEASDVVVLDDILYSVPEIAPASIAPVPSLSEWMLALLAVALTAAAVLRLK